MSEEKTTVSINLSDLSLDELVALSQGFGHDIERLRAKRAYLKIKIDERLESGERNGCDPADAQAPGALIEATSNG